MRITPQIRQAKVEDAALLADLAARTFQDAFGDMNTPQNMQAYVSQAFSLTQITTELNDPQARFLIAEVEGKAVAYAKLYAGNPPASVTSPKPVELARLYVEQEFLGTGVGNDLMQACLDEARAMGHLSVYLGVWEHNARAQSFYFRRGFSVGGSQVFMLGEDMQLDWLMLRNL